MTAEPLPRRQEGPLPERTIRAAPDLADSASDPVQPRDNVSAASSRPVILPADLVALTAQNLVIPVAGVEPDRLVDSFDDKRGADRTHMALDIMAPRNTPVVAASAGSVLKLHSSAAGGLTLYMSDASSRFVFLYGHLDSFRPGLKEGDRVTRGQIIGFVGTTGNASGGSPHLHFQITRSDNPREWWRGTPLNPYPILRPRK